MRDVLEGAQFPGMAMLRLLGQLDLHDDNGREIRRLLGQPKRFALLAYLAAGAPGAFHRRDRLLALFWPESTTAKARHGLRQVLYELTKHLGEEALLRRGSEEVALNPEVVTCDVALLYAAIDADDLARALELYRGPLLDGFFVPGVPEVEQWVEGRRTEIARSVAEVARRLIDVRRNEGDLRGAIAVAERAVGWFPTDEAAARGLITLLEEDGNRGEALRVYEQLSRTLWDEFEVEPSKETADLVTRIRTAIPQTSQERQPASAHESRPAPDVGGASLPETPDPDAAVSAPASTKWRHPATTVILFSLASMGVLSLANAAMLLLSLPEWVLRSAIGLLVIGLPIVVVAAVKQQSGSTVAAPAKPSWLTLRRAVQGGGLAFGGLACITLAFITLRWMGVEPAATLFTKGALEPNDRILVADFSGRPDNSDLSRTLTELIRIDLAQSRAVRPLDPAVVADARVRMVIDPDAPLSTELALEIAQREGVKAVLSGDVAGIGRGYALSVRLLSAADGSLLGAERVTAKGESDLIDAIDHLSAKLRGRIGESLRDVRASPPLERVTTKSLPALRYYTQAMTSAGLQDNQRAGVRMLEQAVALDSMFAMAYRRLAVVYGQTLRPEESRKALRRAFALRTRLPEVERYTVEGLYYASVEYDAAATEAAYRAVLALRPQDPIALVNLAAHQSLTRNWAERETLARQSFAARPGFIAHLNIFYALLLQGHTDEADSLLTQGARRRGTAPEFNLLIDLALARHAYDKAEALIRSAPNLNLIGLSDLLRLRGRFEEAERLLQVELANTVDAPGRHFGATHRLATLRADQGAPLEAIRVLDQFSPDDAQVDEGDLARAELYASLGAVDRARALAAAYEAEWDTGSLRRPHVRAGLHRVAGEIALQEGRFREAVKDFQQVYELSGTCTTCGLARLANAWMMLAQPDSAAGALERMVASHTDGLSLDDARWLPDAHRRLGELYEAQGDTASAIERYRSFVDLWEAADQRLLALAVESRERLVRLEADAPVDISSIDFTMLAADDALMAAVKVKVDRATLYVANLPLG